ncbi:MAG: BCD family MFS transporter [Myxococcota bacterium]
MQHLSWSDIVRFGLVQMAIGSIVALTTSTLNRVMVVELALPAMLPGALVAFYHGIQLTRPHWGFRSDTGGKRTPWIIGGMFALAAGGVAATLGTILFAVSTWLGLIVSVLGFALIGVGAGASATLLLTFLAASTAPNRRAAASTITWLMMIFGIASTAGIVGRLLDPYSHMRLLAIVCGVAAIAVCVTVAAMWGIERRVGRVEQPDKKRVPFFQALAQIWAEPTARRFSVFVLLSMIAYYMQELILEPFAGHVFGLTPGQSTSMSGLQHAGVFVGMLTVGVSASGLKLGSLKGWTIAGCVGSAAVLAGIGGAALLHVPPALLPLVSALGFFNGIFAVGAIGAMMQLAGEGKQGRDGTRMGLWGAAGAIASGSGGFLGAAAVDVMRRVVDQPAEAYATVFILESALFMASALLAIRYVSIKPPR